MTTAAPIEAHDVHSRRLIAHAEIELAKGDRLQASEKAWGAVARRLKSIADRRGWRYETRSQVFGIVKRLADEELRCLFEFAYGLHKNYYADSAPIEQLEYQIGKVKDPLAMLGYPLYSLVFTLAPIRDAQERAKQMTFCT